MGLKDLADLAQVVTGIAVIIAIYQLMVNQRQLYFGAITRCVSRFQEIEIEQETYGSKQISSYIDLVGEELFYFQNGYIPKTVAYEWIDGMLDYLPLTDKKEKVLNPGNCIHSLEKKRNYYLRYYPRIKHAFTVGGHYDFKIAYSEEEKDIEQRTVQRRLIVEEIYNNVKDFSF
jgi:hypothetical protein